jgi:hypothetical protein
MNVSTILLIILDFAAFSSIGILVGLQFVHYTQHTTHKLNFSYFRYIATLLLVLLLVFLSFEIDRNIDRHAFLEYLPIAFMLVACVVTVRRLLRKKGT